MFSTSKGSKKKGIDIEKEKLKMDIFKHKTKSFKHKLEDEIIQDFFGKEQQKQEQKQLEEK